MRILPTILSAASLCLATAATQARADVATGLADFRAGAFAEAQVEWWSAAQAGDPVAALYIGVSYDAGQGLPRDANQAASWYRRAADAGNGAAAFNLAVLYDGGSGAMRDPAKALRWYSRAAALGSARAAYNLGLIYEGGAGVPPDHARAVHFFALAARHGIAAARSHLAGHTAPVLQAAGGTGDGGMREFQQAQLALLSRGAAEAARSVALFRRAAGHGNAFAAYDLGYCYENALGVPRDRAMAYRWYRQASAMAQDGRLKELAANSTAVVRAKLDADELRQADMAGDLR